MIRVFLVDDQQMVRAGFRMLVESQDDMVVVGEAGDGGEALEQLAVTATDVVLTVIAFAWFWPVWTDQLLTHDEWLRRIWFTRWI